MCKKGDIVKNPDAPDWGEGEVLEVTHNGNLKVSFRYGGSRRISPAHVEKVRDGVPRPDNISSTDTPDIGVLRTHGYHVGLDGLSSRERKIKLDAIFLNPLRRPERVSDEYMQQWGEPKTPQRLRKMVWTLANLASGHVARQNAQSYRISIAAWEEDLAYLKRTYYGKYRFPWPYTPL